MQLLAEDHRGILASVAKAAYGVVGQRLLEEGNMNVAVVVQARTASTHLPGKVMLPAAGAPILQRMLERLQLTLVHTSVPAIRDAVVIVATTADANDEPIRDLCRRRGFACYAGDASDLIGRHLGAARALAADVVVRVPADCPVVDPLAVQACLGRFLCESAQGDGVDYVSNLHPATWPAGNEVEVFPMHVLELVSREIGRDGDRSSCTYFVRQHPERFALQNVVCSLGDSPRAHRLVMEDREDYEVIAAIYQALWCERAPLFSLSDALSVLQASPSLRALQRRRAASAVSRA